MNSLFLAQSELLNQLNSQKTAKNKSKSKWLWRIRRPSSKDQAPKSSKFSPLWWPVASKNNFQNIWWGLSTRTSAYAWEKNLNKYTNRRLKESSRHWSRSSSGTKLWLWVLCLQAAGHQRTERVKNLWARIKETEKSVTKRALTCHPYPISSRVRKITPTRPQMSDTMSSSRPRPWSIPIVASGVRQATHSSAKATSRKNISSRPSYPKEWPKRRSTMTCSSTSGFRSASVILHQPARNWSWK